MFLQSGASFLTIFNKKKYDIHVKHDGNKSGFQTETSAN